MRFFVTGTDTGAGKTFVSSLLLRSLTSAGERAVGFKPVACGDRTDAHALQRAAGEDVDWDLINPVYYRHALAPAAAALMENRPFPWQDVDRAWQEIKSAWPHIIVEGAGGWLVPVSATETMADVAVRLHLPVLVVANNRLGALNHTLLTVEAIRASGLRCAGIFLNHPEDERDSASISNPSILRTHLPDVPLFELLHGEEDLPPGVLDALREAGD